MAAAAQMIVLCSFTPQLLLVLPEVMAR